MTCTDSKKKPKRILGLTGGIASGKSTVSGLFRELGAQVICADDLARQVVRPGAPALGEIARVFGAEYLTGNGELNRSRMGELVFADPDARQKLEAILHPRIRQAFTDQVAVFLQADPKAVIVYDAPLLLEVNADLEVAKVVLVQVPRAVQVDRLMSRDNLSQEQAMQRIDAQMAPELRRARADEILDGQAPLEVLRVRLKEIMRSLPE
jgi:dephospho-CoA kinase